VKITYDKRVDVLQILFSDRPIHESDEEKPGLIFDYDKEGSLIGIEMLDASSRVDNPHSVDFSEVAGAAFR
jgi:uncharacterized protein YuzE